ncbi:MAG: hypothetical protein IPI91_14015 [Flavobacteriales bacterium]|nr:hypothetical protein [Flavobacteriales bacterium]
MENLLYDFTLGVGDTLEGFLADNGPGGTGIVVSVDSILVGPNYRKRINIDTTEICIAFSFIEGIGSTTGLTADFYGPGEMGTSLRCFTLGGNVLYTAPCGPPDLVPCGELPIAVVEVPAPIGLPVCISSNPSSGQFTFNTQQPKYIVVYDAFGREVLQTFGTTVDLTVSRKGCMWLCSLRVFRDYAQVVR